MSRYLKPANAALVISILALVAAVVVPAVAQVAGTSVSKKERRLMRKIARLQANKLIGKRAPRIASRQANKKITARAPSLNVNGALSSVSAVSSVNAANADKVDGLDVGCPAGTLLVAGVCFETQKRPAALSYQDAKRDCADEGRYIATSDQLAAFGLVQGGSGGESYEYTSNYYADSGEFRVIGILVKANKIFALSSPTTTSHQYRCVTGPVG